MSGVAPCLNRRSSKIIRSPALSCFRRTCFADFTGARFLVIFIQIRLGAVAFPVQDIEENKLLLVLMWLSHDVGVGPEQIDPECASWPPPFFGH